MLSWLPAISIIPAGVPRRPLCYSRRSASLGDVADCFEFPTECGSTRQKARTHTQTHKSNGRVTRQRA